MFSSNTTQVSGGVSDPQFNYVTMLLHGDGTNGAQNNTFLDSSTNNFTITRNGNTTQGSFSPYGSNWSNYFNGTSDYLSNTGSGTTYDLTGDFCVEGFFNFTSLTDVGVWGIQPANGQAGLRITTESNLTAVLISGNATAHSIITSSVAPIIGQWNHIAVTRSGSALTLWLNGVSVGTGSSASWTGSNLPISIGRSLNYSNATPYYMNGYISNFRVVKGSPVYTSAFTPPTTPLTAITNTQLLTCQSNRYIDNSTNNFAITVNGTPSVQRFNPFGTSTAYSTSVIGGSAYFEGTGNSLACTGTIPATADFTLSLWVYPTNAVSFARAAEQAGTGNTFTLFLGYANGQVGLQVGASAYADYTTGSIKVNQWNYVQVVKASSVFSVYVNGTALSVIASLGNIGTTSIATGSITFTYNVGCYMTDIRIVTSALGNSVPTAPLTAVSGTTTLLNMTNGAIFDNAMMNDLQTVGNAQISTSVVKYGTGSMYFDGIGDYLLTENRTNFNMGSSDFTIEAWVYTGSTSQQVIIGANRNVDGIGAWMFNINHPGFGKVRFFCIYSGSTVLDYNVGTGTISDSAWHHIAVTRSGSSVRIFIDGTQTGTTNTTLGTASINDAIADYRVGSSTDNALNFNGYIDDLRVTKGYARYTANFTPPTAAFPNTGPI
jgi:hypothetical protein